MNKRKDWQAGWGIKSHKPFCQRPSGDLSYPSSGHSGTKRWASTDQAMGISWTSVGHRQTKGRAFIAHAVCTECPKVWRFLGTPRRSAAWLLCIMPHDDFVILRWRYLWYFYQIYDTSMILLVRYFKMYHSSILLYISCLSLCSAKGWYFDTFFIKNFFRMSTCSTVNPKSIWYEIL